MSLDTLTIEIFRTVRAITASRRRGCRRWTAEAWRSSADDHASSCGVKSGRQPRFGGTHIAPHGRGRQRQDSSRFVLGTTANIFVDDGVRGAEFARRQGYMRLLNTMKPRPPFSVLIVSELSRLGREQFETGYAVKQIAQAGVRIVSYLEDRKIQLKSATDKFIMAAVNFAAEVEREKARQRVTDAMARNAARGYTCGGDCYGNCYSADHVITGLLVRHG